jgi:glycosyltransferase involved in cell wall biosynthesis
VIPSRDRWSLLRRAIGSALVQEGVRLEVIVVLDRSTDASLDELTAMGDARVSVLCNDRAGTVSRVRNLGLAQARGEWVAFLDDDDMWAPDKLRKQLAAARSREAGFAYADAVHIDRELRVVRQAQASPAPDGLDRVLLRTNLIPAGCSNAIARTALVQQLGGFDEDLHVCADWDLWVRIALATRGARVQERLVGYTEHPGNMVVREPDRALAEFNMVADKHREAARDRGIRVDRLGYHEWLAHGLWRAGRRRDALRLMAHALRTEPLTESLVFLPRTAIRRVRERRRATAPPPAPSWLRMSPLEPRTEPCP